LLDTLLRHVQMKGDVFSNDLIGACPAYKRENEADQVQLRPIPEVTVARDRRLRL